MLVSVALAKTHLQITHSQEDDLLGVFIAGAQEQIERYCQTKVEETELTERTETLEGGGLILSPSVLPLVSLTSLTDTSTGEEVPAEDYIARNYGLIRVDGKPWDAGFYEVEYTGGYTEATAPSGLSVAILQMVSRFYYNRKNATSEGGLSFMNLTESDLDKLLWRYSFRARVGG